MYVLNSIRLQGEYIPGTVPLTASDGDIKPADTGASASFKDQTHSRSFLFVLLATKLAHLYQHSIPINKKLMNTKHD